MKTIKVIDLLNKIAKGEKIRFKDNYRSYDECDISTFLENYITGNWDRVEDDTDWLNEEIEEVEDKKLPIRFVVYPEDGEYQEGDFTYIDNKLYRYTDGVFCMISEYEEYEDIEKLHLYLLDGNESAMPTTLQDFNNQEIIRKINALIKNQKKIINEIKNKD